jgi:hypothetical protein
VFVPLTPPAVGRATTVISPQLSSFLLARWIVLLESWHLLVRDFIEGQHNPASFDRSARANSRIF